jgi:hypothetical protein
MAINFTYTFSAATVISSSEVNQNNIDLRTAIRGAHHRDADGTLIANADVSASAAIVESKIAFHTSTGHKHDGSGSRRLTWGEVWANAVHDHTNNANGGSLDARYLRSNADDESSGRIAALRYSITGTGGNGYISVKKQSSNPSPPGSSADIHMYMDGNDNLKFRRSNGNSATVTLSWA